MKTQVKIAALALVLAATTVTAEAQTGRHRHRHYYDDGPYTYVVPVQVCQKMCPQDFSPCDPIYFKTADGRCAGIMPGGR